VSVDAQIEQGQVAAAASPAVPSTIGATTPRARVTTTAGDNRLEKRRDPPRILAIEPVL
jgi:hypothetical protein